MNWRYHSFFALGIGWAILGLTDTFLYNFNLTLTKAIITTLLLMIFGLLPDIDHAMSKITKIFLTVGLFVIIVGAIDLLSQKFFSYDLEMINGEITIAVGIIFMLYTVYVSTSNGFFVHRGGTHTLWYGALMVSILYFIGLKDPIYLLAGALGYLLHLIGDSIPFKMSIQPRGSE